MPSSSHRYANRAKSMSPPQMPQRQVQVIEELGYIQTHDPSRAAEVLLYFQDENMKYRLN